MALTRYGASEGPVSELAIPHGPHVALATSRGEGREAAGVNEGELVSRPGAHLALATGGMRFDVRVLDAAADAPPMLRVRIVP